MITLRDTVLLDEVFVELHADAWFLRWTNTAAGCFNLVTDAKRGEILGHGGNQLGPPGSQVSEQFRHRPYCSSFQALSFNFIPPYLPAVRRGTSAEQLQARAVRIEEVDGFAEVLGFTAMLAPLCLNDLRNPFVGVRRA